MHARQIASTAVGLLVAIAADAQDGVREMPSQKVAPALEELLARDRIAELDRIDVSENEGRVTLRGTVPTLIAKERAARVARTVKGVRHVVNEIALQPRETLPATELRAVVRTALLTNPATQSHQIRVDAEPDGSINLSGTVASWAERDAAGQVAKSISGVTAVHNGIGVEYATTRVDSEVAADINRLLHWDAYLGDNSIDVAVHKGGVSLTGAVDSSAEKSHASRLAWIAGTKSVDVTGLNVVSDGATTAARKQREAGTSDQDIGAAVRSRLELSAAVSNPVDVEVVRGAATLRGAVETLEAKRKAAAMASQVAGVERVENELQVASAGDSSDDDLQARIAGALKDDPLTDAYQIEVDVKDGIVDLAGNVGSWIEKGAAEDLVAGMRGVRAINNRLQVLDYARARRTN